MIDLPGSPEVVEKHGQFSGHPDDGFLPGGFPSALCPRQSPTPQIGIRAKGSHLIVSRLDQETSQHFVAGFGDPALWVSVSGLILSGTESEVGANRPAVLELVGVFQGQDERQGGDGSNALNLLQHRSLGITLVGEGLNSAIVLPDLDRQQLQMVQEGTKCILESVGKTLKRSIVKCRGAAPMHATSSGFDSTADMIDETGPSPHQDLPGSKNRQILMGLLCPVTNPAQQGWVQPGQAGEDPGIQPIALSVASVDHTHLSGVGDDDFVAELREQLTDPARVGPDLQGNPRGGKIAKPLPEGLGRGSNATLLGDLSVSIEHGEVAEPIAQVQADR
jgi:hypothetical protein